MLFRSAIALRDEPPRRPDEHRHVDVVTAGVHDRDLAPALVDLHCRRRVGEPALLADREPIHVGTHEHEGTFAVSEQADDAGAPDALGHVDAELPQLPGEPLRRLPLEEGELGMAMEMLEEGAEMLVVVLFDGGTARGAVGGRRGRGLGVGRRRRDAREDGQGEDGRCSAAGKRGRRVYANLLRGSEREGA